MIKVFNCKKKSINHLHLFLEKRRSGKRLNTNIVVKIVDDVKKKRGQALLKYEKQLSNNKELKPSKD